MIQNNHKLRLYIKVLYRDSINIIKYGIKAPKYAERVWINPTHINYKIHLGKKYSGVVVNFKDIIKYNRPVSIFKDVRIQSCIEHWVNGIPWERTKDYQNKLQQIKNSKIAWDNDCYSVRDLNEKYLKLDSIFDEIKKTRKLMIRKEINRYEFRELNSFGVNIDNNGAIYLDSGGYHRFAIAYILKLQKVPARLGCIDYRQIKKLNKYRNTKRTFY